MIKFYKFNCKYWIDIDETDIETMGFVAAEDWNEAVSKLTHRLPNMSNLYMEEWIGDTDFVFVDSTDRDLLNRLMPE